MRKLIAAFAILIGVAFFGEGLLRTYAADHMSEQLAAELELAGRPEVVIGGFPFVLEVVRGRFDSISVRARRTTAEGVTLRDVELTFTDVHVSVMDALINDIRRIRIGGAEGTAILPLAELEAAGAPVDALPSEGEIAIDSNALVVGGQSFGLPAIGFGFDYRSARLTDDGIELTLGSGPRSLRL